MKKNIVLSLAVLSLLNISLLSARHGGGDAFAGGLAGGMVGGVVSGAMQPKQKTVVVDKSSSNSDYLRDQNYQLQRENDQLKRDLSDLERRLEKLEGRK